MFTVLDEKKQLLDSKRPLSREVLTNLKKIVNVLKTNCKAGLLKLDLDVETYLGLKPAADSCEL